MKTVKSKRTPDIKGKAVQAGTSIVNTVCETAFRGLEALGDVTKKDMKLPALVGFLFAFFIYSMIIEVKNYLAFDGYQGMFAVKAAPIAVYIILIGASRLLASRKEKAADTSKDD